MQYGIVSTEYFLDKMKPYELSIICESLHLRTKDAWEQTRMLSYIMAQVNSKKRLKPTDIIKFAWEKEQENGNKPISSHSKTLTLDEVNKIKQLALQREQRLKEKGII